MPDYDEVARSLTGAWHLFLDRPDALRFFDVSYDGFWRSFGAIVLLIPFYAVIALAERAHLLSDSIADPGFDGTLFLVNKGVGLALDWIMLPLVLALVARPLGVDRTYATWVVARNWGAVIAVTPFGLIALLSLLGILSDGIVGLVSLIVLLIVIRYSYLIARRALGVDIGFAVALIATDFAIGLTIIGVVDAVLPYAPSS